ncbi:MAG TPA: sigma-70 family RNA polymerase sigma factor [Pseudonocardiaceae bacterium]
MSVSDDVLARQFAEHRGHLLGVAYRLTGVLADAEDAVQEAWLRLSRLAPEARATIQDLRAWLTTVVGRICLDRIRSAAAQRERYVGPWLPEPIVTPLTPTPGRNDDPLEEVVRNDGVRMAVLVVLHRLTPEQRVAFVLHDAFGVPFAEIAEILGCSPAAARQHASRARRLVAEAEPPPRVELAEQQRLLTSFVAALSSGDTTRIVRLLHPHAQVFGDGGGKARTARRVIFGADKVARFLLGLLGRYGEETLHSARPVLVNGDLGLVFRTGPGEPGRRVLPPRVATFAFRDGRLAAVYDIVNPDKLVRVHFDEFVRA